MRRLIATLGTVLIVVMAAGPAAAKGVSSMTIEGPGLDEPLVIDADEWGDPWELQLTTAFWVFMYDGTMKDARGTLLSEAPTGDLGPMYTITWYLGGEPYPSTTKVYPMAPGGPLVHVAPSEGGILGTSAIPGGWLAADASLLRLLDWYGVPMEAVDKTTAAPNDEKQAVTPMVAADTKTAAEPAAIVVPEVVPEAPELVASPVPVADAVPRLPFVIAGLVSLAAGGWWAAGRRPGRLRAS